MALKSFRIGKASKKLKARTDKMAALLTAGINEERKQAASMFGD